MTDLAAIRDAAALLQGVVHRTPLARSATFSRLVGAAVHLKCENLQRSGSFKVRGAYVRIRRLGVAERAKGVVAASAGNHAQGVALAAAAAGLPATIVMPRHAPMAKVMATEGYGARVLLHGESYDEAAERAKALAAEAGATYIHAFDHPDVIVGQGTVGLEIVEGLPDVGTVVVPVGGGGLISGVAIAVKGVRPQARVVGVQAEGAAAFVASRRAGHPVVLEHPSTIADGIAVKRPGSLTFEIVERTVDDLVTVSDEEIASTILLCLERAKVLVEGAGAAALAALLHGRVKAEPAPVVAILSGGNIDMNFLTRILGKGLAKAGRYLQLEVPVMDRPGALKALLAVVADEQANVVSVSHDRLDPRGPVDRVEVYLTLETRDAAHARRLLQALRKEGYAVRRRAGPSED
ncbi:MAG: threonine ammonia-lyase [candidate division NC10 bacterium]|nr:threonine ammonia-lyase [candidate division NC10 bacterium]